VEPWVPASAVAEFYSKLRHQMHPARGRPLSEESANLVRFVVAERRSAPDITWRELAQRWSREHPDRPEEDYRHFRQAFIRARQSLLYPGYRPYRERRS
jgi:hypothetical protein